MSKIIGIDLGTTNSCVAYLLGDRPEVIPNSEGKRTTPSVVYIKDNELLVGELAKRKMLLEPARVIYESKRFIGRKYEEVKDLADKMGYKVKKGSDGGVVFEIDGKEYKPEQIGAFVLKKIKEDAEKYLGEKIDRAVITVPAYFNDSQRKATKVAGEIAGFKVERIINEPTAAALAYGLGKNKDEKVLVFDLGGGTFDVTVLEIGAEGTFQVLSTSGDTQLGGADFDQKIMDYLVEKFKEKYDIDLRENSMAMQRIREEAENAKKQLSTVERVDITIPFITTDKNGQPLNLEEALTRAQFEEMCDDLIERTKKPVLQAIEDAKLSKDEIDEVILVGGSTRMPWVSRIIKELLGKEPKATVNPDEAVAMGAAIQGGIIQGDVKDILLMDVTPLSLGVEVEGGLVSVMIPRNTTIPAKKSQIYTTAEDNQKAVTIHVVQGERPMARDNKSLGMFHLEGIPPMPRGVPQIEVTFDIDANGILTVTAKEKSTGKTQSIKIEGSTNLSEEEIEKAKKEAEQFAEEDRKKRELIETKNKLEQEIYLTKKLLKENEAKLPKEAKEELEKLIKEAEEKLKDEKADKDTIDKFIKKLQDEVQKVWQKYGAQVSNTGGNPDYEIKDEEKKNGDTEVVEGEVVDEDKKEK